MSDNVFTNYIGRVVAFVLTPLLLPLAATVAVWIQDVLGIDLDGAQLTGYVIAVVTGVALAAFQWLRNRGLWEQAQLELAKLEAAGRNVIG